MAEGGEQRPIEVRLETPDDLEAGVYANYISPWHSPHEFTIIFDVLRALNLTMTNHEAVYGEIRRPEGGWNSP